MTTDPDPWNRSSRQLTALFSPAAGLALGAAGSPAPAEGSVIRGRGLPDQVTGAVRNQVKDDAPCRAGRVRLAIGGILAAGEGDSRSQPPGGGDDADCAQRDSGGRGRAGAGSGSPP